MCRIWTIQTFCANPLLYSLSYTPWCLELQLGRLKKLETGIIWRLLHSHVSFPGSHDSKARLSWDFWPEHLCMASPCGLDFSQYDAVSCEKQTEATLPFLPYLWKLALSFCYSLLVKSKSLRPARFKGKGIGSTSWWGVAEGLQKVFWNGK